MLHGTHNAWLVLQGLAATLIDALGYHPCYYAFAILPLLIGVFFHGCRCMLRVSATYVQIVASMSGEHLGEGTSSEQQQTRGRWQCPSQVGASLRGQACEDVGVTPEICAIGTKSFRRAVYAGRESMHVCLL